MLGQDRREAQEPGPGRQRQAAVHRGGLDRAAHRRADHHPVALRHERRVRRVVEVLVPLGERLLERRRDDLREDGRAHLVLAERHVQADEGLDVLALRTSYDDPLREGGRLVERLADRMHVLVPEAEAEPCVDQLGIGRGDDRVV